MTYRGRLRKEHLALIEAERERWLAAGLSTEPCDRPAAERAVAAAYRAAGFDPPRIVVWMDSPLGGSYACAALEQLGSRLRYRFGSRLWREFRAQVRAQLPDQSPDHIRDTLWDDRPTCSSLRLGLTSPLHFRLLGQLRVELEAVDQLHVQLGEWLEWRLEHDLGHQSGWTAEPPVPHQVWSQVRDELWGRLSEQLGAHVGAQLWDDIWGLYPRSEGARAWAMRPRWLGGGLWSLPLADPNLRTGHALSAWSDAFDQALCRCGLAIAGLPPSPRLDALAGACMESGWWWPMRGAVVLTDRPDRLRLDPDGRLHADDGPALRFRDGDSVYAWHGTRVPAWVVEEPTPGEIAAELNVEVRRCAIESLGWDRFAADAQLERVAVSPDPANPGQHIELFDVPERLWGSRMRLALVTNASPERDGTRRRYGITVPADIDDPVAAIAWTYGLDRDSYAGIARRT